MRRRVPPLLAGIAVLMGLIAAAGQPVHAGIEPRPAAAPRQAARVLAAPHHTTLSAAAVGAEPGLTHPSPSHPFLSRGGRQAPASPRAGSGAVLTASVSNASAAVTPDVVSSFAGASLNSDVSLFGSDQAVTPPDTQIAAGPNDLVAPVNDTLTVWSKAGAVEMTADLNSFFAVPSGSTVTDPRVIYDVASSRWMLSAFALDGANDSIVYLAVSTSSNPNGLFNVYDVAALSATVTDQPKLGLDATVAVVSWNDYTGSPQSFAGEETWVLQLSDLLAGTAVASDQFGPDATRFGIVPAQSLTATTTEYLAYNDSCGSSTSGACNAGGVSALGVVALGGTPAGGNVTWLEADPQMTATVIPPAADQPGRAASIDTDDDRFLATVFEKGTLYISGNDACTPTGDSAVRPCSRLVEAAVTSSGASLTVDNDLADAGAALYYPAVVPDAAGDVFVAATYSATATAAQAMALTVTPTASSFAGATVATGAGAYSYSGCGATTPCRWGDYSGAAVDPTSPTHVWIAAEYTPAGGSNWATTIGEIALPATHLGVAAPAAVVTSSQSSVTVSALDVNSNVAAGYRGTVRLTSSDGSATLPPAYSFTPMDSGSHALPVQLRTLGNQTVTATDTSTSITGSSPAIAVVPFHPQGVGAPVVALTPDGSIQTVFWRGTGGHLFEAWYAGGWNGPVDWTAAAFGGADPLASAPSVAVTPTGIQLIFWQGTNGHLYEAWYAGGWNGPVDWTAAAFGGAAPLASAPSVALLPNGSTQLIFWQGTDGHLDEAWYANGWHGPVDWTSAAFGGGAPLTSSPSVAITPDGATQLIFWQGAGGHLDEAWYHNGWNGPVDWTAAVFGGAGPLTSAPSVALTPDGTTQLIFWQGAGGHLDEVWYHNGWNGPVDWTAGAFNGAGVMTSAPSVALTPDGSTQLIFWQGYGSTLTEAWFAGGWNGPVTYGG